jgi:hypothetical protein
MSYIKKLFSIRDELSFRNFRMKNWAAFLIFPIALIFGDLRYLDQEMTLFGIDSTSLILVTYGIGWLIVMAVPKEQLIAVLRIAAVLSAALLPFQIIMDAGLPRLWVFLAFHLANGVCTAIGFYLFCFAFNNVERLSALILIQIYYALIPYMFWDITAVADFMKLYGSAGAAALLLIAVFSYRKEGAELGRTDEKREGRIFPSYRWYSPST